MTGLTAGLIAAALFILACVVCADAAPSWQPIYQHDEAGFTFQLGEGACIRGPIRLTEKRGAHRTIELHPGEDRPSGCSRSFH